LTKLHLNGIVKILKEDCFLTKYLKITGGKEMDWKGEVGDLGKIVEQKKEEKANKELMEKKEYEKRERSLKDSYRELERILLDANEVCRFFAKSIKEKIDSSGTIWVHYYSWLGPYEQYGSRKVKIKNNSISPSLRGISSFDSCKYTFEFFRGERWVDVTVFSGGIISFLDNVGSSLKVIVRTLYCTDSLYAKCAASSENNNGYRFLHRWEEIGWDYEMVEEHPAYIMPFSDFSKDKLASILREFIKDSSDSKAIIRPYHDKR
jgi:hypothetical protein